MLYDTIQGVTVPYQETYIRSPMIQIDMSEGDVKENNYHLAILLTKIFEDGPKCHGMIKHIRDTRRSYRKKRDNEV